MIHILLLKNLRNLRGFAGADARAGSDCCARRCELRRAHRRVPGLGNLCTVTPMSDSHFADVTFDLRRGTAECGRRDLQRFRALPP